MSEPKVFCKDCKNRTPKRKGSEFSDTSYPWECSKGDLVLDPIMGETRTSYAFCRVKNSGFDCSDYEAAHE